MEERASKLPLMGCHPPLHQGGTIKTGKVLPPSTIQTDLARSPAAVGLARVLLPAEDSLMQVQRDQALESSKTCAFIKLASERCCTIILELPDSGYLCRMDIISMATFKALNKCTNQKLILEPLSTDSDI